MRLPRNFNPLHHEGGDVGGMAISVGSDFISIHSTTRVETKSALKKEILSCDFNPLHHEGGDTMVIMYLLMYGDFNPLHHEGGDLPG